MAGGLTAEEAKSWMESNPDKAGTPAFVTVKKAYDALSAAPAPAPAAVAPAAPAATPPAAGGGSTALPAITVDESGAQPPAAPSVPISGTGEYPPAAPAEPSQYDVANKQLDDQGGVLGFLRKANELPRTIGRGIIGDWGDRINAGAYSLMPEALGGRPYAEGLEMERSRNAQSDAAHPVGNAVAKGVGAVMGAAAQPNKGALANTLIDMLVSGVRGAGGGNTDLTTAQGLKDAAVRGGEDAFSTGIVSGPLNKLMSTLRPYSQVMPEVVAAAERMGIKLPFFARAADPDIQAAGRRYAQTNLKSPVNQAWNEGVTGTTEAAANTAVRGTGAPEVAIAPYSAGYQVHPGMQASIDAAQTEKTRLGDEIASLLQPGARYDVPGTRATTRDMVRERRGFEEPNPRAGLESPLRVGARPPPTEATQGPWGQRGGSTWDELSNLATDIGQKLGLPPTVPRAVDDARLGKIYSALREDQRGIMRAADAADAAPPVAPGAAGAPQGAASAAPAAPPPGGPLQIPAMPHQVEAAEVPQIAPSSSSTAVGAPRLSDQSTGGQLATAVETPVGPVRPPGAAPEQPGYTGGGYDRPREEIFNRNVERQRVLSENQRQIDDAMKERPEAIVNLAHSAATTSGAGTDINTLHTMVTAMTPEQRQILGSGVLGKIVNDAGGSPQRIASALNVMPDEARALLFTPGSQLAADVADLRTVAGQVGRVNDWRGVGSIASGGQNMLTRGLRYGGLGASGMLAGGLAHLANASPTATGVAAAAGAAIPAGIRSVALPYLYRNGINPSLQSAAEILTRGTSQTSGAPIANTLLGKERGFF